MTALRGLRVLDLSRHRAGAVAGMLLAGFGSEVLRLDHSPERSGPGRADDADAVELAWHRGKRRLHQAPWRVPTELMKEADVCLLDGSVGDLTEKGLEPAALARRHHRLVVVHLGPFTDSAPWSGQEPSETLAWAGSGLCLRQASHDGGPIELVVPVLTVLQGVWAAAAAAAALYERETSGRGQVVGAHAAHAMVIAGAAAFTFNRAAPDPSPPGVPRVGGAGGPIPFYRPYRCRDDQWLFLAALTPHFTQRAFSVLGRPHLLEDPRLEGGGRAALLRPENSEWAMEEMAAVFSTRDRDEWLALLTEAGCPAGPLLDRESWLDHPQLSAIGMRVDGVHPRLGAFSAPGIPLHMTATPPLAHPPLESSPLTVPGWSRDTGWTARSGEEPTPPGAPDGPLAGVRVIDLGAIIAGPFAGSLLAELGADVVKVEPPAGDSFRGPGFAAYNKGQRGIVLDLQSEGGRQALLELIRGADVVIDNYRPGVLDRLGISYQHLQSVRPDIITVTITGFGSGGPLGDQPGFDPVLQAMSGMMSAQGGSSDPVFFTVPVNDVTTATVAAAGACLALLHRRRTGRGQAVRTSLAGISAFLQAEDLVRFGGRPTSPSGGRDFSGPELGTRFYRVEDGWFRVESPGATGAELAADLGVVGLEEPLPISAAEAVLRLQAAGRPSVVVPDPRGLASDAEILSQGILHADPRPERHGWWTAGRQAHFSRTPRTGTLSAPAMGEHTREVLVEAGMEAGRVEALVTEGVARGPAPR
jgi:crotonobetainyl-CoA:carnitine CoA-transferase CaiB-like acyl-CoA transferase